jgi:hypothetical protein
MKRLLDPEAPLGEALLERLLRLEDGRDADRLVVEGLGVHFPERRQDAVLERVDDERLDVERPPAELLRDLHGVRDRVEERDVRAHGVAVGRLDVDRVGGPVRLAPEDLLAEARTLAGLALGAGRLEDVHLPRERVHRDAGPDHVEARSERLLHDSNLEAELPLLDPHLVGKDADRTGRVEEDHGDDAEDARDAETLHGRLDRVERGPLAGDLHHHEPPSIVF